MKTKLLALALLAAAAASAAFLLLRGEQSPSVARITRDGVLVEEIDLSRVEQPYTITLEGSEGSNTIAVEPGRIRVLEADCPDQVCVRQGWISDGTAPIVCLPHRLVIELAGTGGEPDAGAG